MSCNVLFIKITEDLFQKYSIDNNQSNIKIVSSLARSILKKLIVQKFGVRSTDVEFSRNEYGKPYLIGYPNFYFNISHTDDVVVIVTADTEIGIDIEKIREYNPKIMKRFFTADEQLYIDNSINKNKAFFEIWTKKEAYIKYIGKGFSIPLNSFCTISNDFSCRIKTTLINDYVISVCSEGNDFSLSIQIL